MFSLYKLYGIFFVCISVSKSDIIFKDWIKIGRVMIFFTLWQEPATKSLDLGSHKIEISFYSFNARFWWKRFLNHWCKLILGKHDIPSMNFFQPGRPSPSMWPFHYVPVSFFLCLCPCLYVSGSMSLSVCPCLYVPVSMSLSLCLCLYASVSVSMSLSLCLCLYVSV